MTETTPPETAPVAVPDTAVGYGFLTIVGSIAAAIAAFCAALAAVLNGDHTAETVTALVTAGGILATVLRERGRQSAAKIEVAGKVREVIAVAATTPTLTAVAGELITSEVGSTGGPGAAELEGTYAGPPEPDVDGDGQPIDAEEPIA